MISPGTQVFVFLLPAFFPSPMMAGGMGGRMWEWVSESSSDWVGVGMGWADLQGAMGARDAGDLFPCIYTAPASSPLIDRVFRPPLVFVQC